MLRGATYITESVGHFYHAHNKRCPITLGLRRPYWRLLPFIQRSRFQFAARGCSFAPCPCGASTMPPLSFPAMPTVLFPVCAFGGRLQPRYYYFYHMAAHLSISFAKAAPPATARPFARQRSPEKGCCRAHPPRSAGCRAKDPDCKTDSQTAPGA